MNLVFLSVKDHLQFVHSVINWVNETDKSVEIIDQTKLPHSLDIISLKNLTDVVIAIKIMQVRGAPLIGGTAAYGIVLAMKEDPTNDNLINSDGPTYLFEDDGRTIIKKVEPKKGRFLMFDGSIKHAGSMQSTGVLKDSQH